jgi:predicted nucleotidyltransferase
MSRDFYSIRTGKNKNLRGLPLGDIVDIFLKVYQELRAQGYFDEYLGWTCVDMGEIPGHVTSPDLDIFLKIRKKHLWPVEDNLYLYDEDDLFDMIEYLFTTASKPVDGTYHSYADCGMHWEKFNKEEGEESFRARINELLGLYERPFELSKGGEILETPEPGFEAIFTADTPTADQNVRDRIDSAVRQYRRHGATIDDRRQAVRDLADVLEYLRPKLKGVLDRKDEADLFHLANNFAIRHHNSRQKRGYDAALWLSWMFYVYLATIHVVLRKLEDKRPELPACRPGQITATETK